MRISRYLAAAAILLAESNRERPLADIPNRAGFRFTGHRKDGTKLQCVVTVERTGMHLATCVESGRHVYHELRAWSPAEL
jgi:hypothetical protein